MRRAVILCSSASFLMGLLGAVVGTTLAVPAMVGAQAAQVLAERVTVAGADGADRVRLDTGPGVEAAMQVLAPNGTTRRIDLRTGGAPNTAGTLTEAASVNVFALDGTLLTRLGTNAPAGSAGRLFQEGSLLVMNDAQGHPRIVAEVNPEGNPVIVLLDADGNVTWSAP